MKQKTVTTQVRIPESLHESIKNDADERASSMNAEIVRRLEDFDGAKRGLAEVKLLQEKSDIVFSETQAAAAEYKQAFAQHKEITRQAILLMIDFIADKDKTPEKERDMSLALLRFLSSVDKPL